MTQDVVTVIINSENTDLAPHYTTLEAAGADIRANLDMPVVIAPGETALIPTGLRFAIPIGYEIQVRPRSGIALRHGVTVLNSPGTIDSDYRGEVKIILINHGKENFTVKHQDRIAQIILAPVSRADFSFCTEFEETTVRGAGGFGSTGI